MTLETLERRGDKRIETFVPILLKNQEAESVSPAHLVDFSTGGAGVLATTQNAPAMGDYLDLEFEPPTNDGACESRTRKETAVVVHRGLPNRGVQRIGLRFMQRPDVACDLFDPDDELDGFSFDPTAKFTLHDDDRWSIPSSCERERVALSAF